MFAILKQWRAGVLALLLVGPVAAYVGFGTIWLWERGWLWVAALLWILAGAAFSILSARWTRTVEPIMPPLDWDSPSTFSPRDRQAWKIVEEEAESGESLAMEAMLNPNLYGDTGRRLAHRLASFYHPNASNPLDEVPLVELLTAIELAAEDLAHLSHQVPGGDVITLAHWRRAVQVAGYLSKANDIYSVLSPILNPLSGMVRLGTRELIVKPAWRDMRQNVLRWFYQAYVNRLGVHLVELMSGRLAIGADQYRRLTRRGSPTWSAGTDAGAEPLAVAVAGARGSGKSSLIRAIREVLGGDPVPLRARLEDHGVDPDVVRRLAEVRWTELPGHAPNLDTESRRDRQSRRHALAAATDCDFLILVVDGRKGLQPGDVAFAQEWDRYFIEHPQREVPPVVLVVTGVDGPEFGPVWAPPYDWSAGHGLRETAVRALFDSLRTTLPPTFSVMTAAGLPGESSSGVAEHVVPALASVYQRAERSSLIRQLQALSSRSKLGRVASQLGQQGRHLWRHVRARHGKKAAPPSEQSGYGLPDIVSEPPNPAAPPPRDRNR